jgi:2-phospho-L-lactate guanylyltransferase
VSTLAVLPVKVFGEAKQRLVPALAADRRRELAEAMVADVLAALGGVPGLPVAVVTAEPAAREAALAAGADVVEDTEQAGQSAAAAIGVRHALEHGFERVLLVPGDTPLLDPDELRALLASSAAVTIVPDRHGTGTNGLLLAPPDAIAPSFGPGSFERHREAAGGSARVERPSTLTLDVDTGDDLGELLEALAARPGAAPATRSVLAPSRVTA